METQSASPFHLTPWVRRLLVANGVVYVLAITLFTGTWFTDLFAFSPLESARRPWTFVTYMFVHVAFLHLAFDMLMLFFFGPRVERRMGGAAFARFYLLCGLGGPVMAFALLPFLPVTALVGASGAAFGVALAFALYWPHARIFVFPLPVPVPVKYLVVILVAFEMIPLVTGVSGGLAQIAHLGGFLFALLYLKGENYVDRRVRAAVEAETETPVLVPHQVSESEAEEAGDAPRPAEPSRDDIVKEMDRLLDKISEQGMSSLTIAERRFLDDMSRHMRRP